MIRNIIILSLILFTSCEYDYIHDNPSRPQEYCGHWNCDSTYLNGVKNNSVTKQNFLIMQTGVEITSAVDVHKIKYYYDWKLDKSGNIPIFVLYNSDYVIQLTYEVVKEPSKGQLALKLNNIVYYLH